MIQLSELLAMRDALDRAIFAGVRRVQMPDRAVDYASVDEMRKARADLDARINEASNTVPPPFTLATHSRD
jgi:hypothetical protein